MGKRLSQKRGFTLIEMAVVMGIIAVLTLIGIGGLLSGRANGVANAAAEDILTQIRDAQNRSTSIAQDSIHNSSDPLPKGWGVKVTNTGFSLVSYYTSTPSATTLTREFPAEYSSTSNSNIGAVTYDIVVRDPSNNNNIVGGTHYKNLFVTFMAPFGTPYLYATTGNEECTTTTTNCYWTNTPAKATQEWYPHDTSVGGMITRSNGTAGYSVYITATYQNVSSTVVVDSSGDVSIQ